MSTGIQPRRRLVSDRPACRHLRGGMNTQWRRRRREIAERSRRQSGDASLMTVVLGLVVGALLTVTTGLWCMRQLEEFGPSIGGMIVFKPDPIASERWVVNAVRLAHG